MRRRRRSKRRRSKKTVASSSSPLTRTEKHTNTYTINTHIQFVPAWRTRRSLHRWISFPLDPPSRYSRRRKKTSSLSLLHSLFSKSLLRKVFFAFLQSSFKTMNFFQREKCKKRRRSTCVFEKKFLRLSFVFFHSLLFAFLFFCAFFCSLFFQLLFFSSFCCSLPSLCPSSHTKQKSRTLFSRNTHNSLSLFLSTSHFLKIYKHLLLFCRCASSVAREYERGTRRRRL